jgi:hypothetical protein
VLEWQELPLRILKVPVQVSAWILDILTDLPPHFPQSFHVNAMIVPSIKSLTRPSLPYLINYSFNHPGLDAINHKRVNQFTGKFFYNSYSSLQSLSILSNFLPHESHGGIT